MFCTSYQKTKNILFLVCFPARLKSTNLAALVYMQNTYGTTYYPFLYISYKILDFPAKITLQTKFEGGEV